MSRLTLISVVCALAACGPPARPAEQAELRDFISYFRSVRTPTVVEACAPVVADKEGFASAARNWLNANADAIARGRKAALSKLNSERELDDSNADMLVKLKDEFARRSEAKKNEFCADAYNSYKLPART